MFTQLFKNTSHIEVWTRVPTYILNYTCFTPVCGPHWSNVLKSSEKCIRHTQWKIFFRHNVNWVLNIRSNHQLQPARSSWRQNWPILRIDQNCEVTQPENPAHELLGNCWWKKRWMVRRSYITRTPHSGTPFKDSDDFSRFVHTLWLNAGRVIMY